jgi:integrase
MSLEPSSRKSAAPAGPTLADVLDAIAADRSLPRRRLQDQASAIRRLARAFGQRPEEIPAHPAYLQQRLKGFSPAMAGLSPRRWRNVLSLTRAALKQAGLSKVPGRYCGTLSPVWADLYRYLNEPRLRIGLSRFVHFCSDHEIAPNEVDDAAMQQYLDALENGGLVRSPRKIHRETCVYWNRAQAAIASWPKTPVTVPSYRETYSLAWEAFPASLKVEVDAQIYRLAGTDLLDEIDFRPLKPSSLSSRDYQLRQFASALVRQGRDPASLRSLADLVAVDTVKEGLRFFLERSGNKPTKMIHGIACTLKAIARHAVKVDHDHLDQLQSICRRLDPGRGGMTDKNRNLLRQFDDPSNVGALINLPQRLLAEARRHKTPTRSDALLVMAAVAIEILIMVPIRIGNLAGLSLDKHLLRSGSPKRPILHLWIPGTEVKNGFDIEAGLTAATIALIDAYLKDFRPLLTDIPSPWLFPAMDDRHRGRNALAATIKETIARKTGLRFNPHLARHFAAKLHLTEHPGDYGSLRLVEGHKTLETLTRSYCGTETVPAFKRYDEYILKLREQHSAVRPKLRRASGEGR